MQGSERWRPLTGNNPSARLRAARSMPQWLHARGNALPPPPPPPEEPAPDPDYEVIEFPGQTYSNTPLQPEVKSRSEGKRCDLCGSTAPAVQCAQCSQQNFCPSCDDMYHRHPKRQSHIRKALADHHHQQLHHHHLQGFRPPLPPKGEPAVAPVPPPRRNRRIPPPSPHLHHQQPSSRPITPQAFDQVVGPAKKDSIVGSLKRMITGRPLPPPPMTRQMDRFGGMQPQAQMGFQDPRVVGRDFGHPEWELDRNQRAGSMTALNMVPPFGPMMQAHSMAQLNCPSCHHHGLMWGDWNTGQMWAGPGGVHNHGNWQGSGMIPPYRAEDEDVVSRRNSLRPQRYRPRGGSSSDEEDEVMSRRRTVDSDIEDSEEDERLHNRNRPKRMPRRSSLVEGLNRARRQDEDTMSVRGATTVKRYHHEPMTPRSSRKMEETASNRGGRRRDLEEVITMPRLDDRRFDDEIVSNRGGRKSDLDETMSIRSSRRADGASSIRGGRRREVEEAKMLSRLDNKRFNDEVMSNRGGRKSDMDETMSLKSGRRTSDAGKKKNDRFSDTGRRRRSPVDIRKNSSPRIPSDAEYSELSPGLVPNGSVPPVETLDLETGDEVGEDDLEPVAPMPTSEWECRHCTYVNQAGTRVCAVCCKTTTRPKQQPPDEQQKALSQHQKEQCNHQQKTANRHPIYADVELHESLKKMNLNEAPPTKASTGTSPRPLKKKGLSPAAVEPNKTVTSKGTSPPPQSISTQTYEVLGRKLKRATSLADHEWNQPLRSQSRQSLLSDTQSLPVTPPRGRSPDLDNLSQAAESQTESLAHSLSSRRISEPATLSRNSRRAGSQPPDYISTLVQKQVKQGLEMVKLLRDAEEHQFSAEDLGVALSHCGDGDPVGWLIDNWRNMIDTVVTLATNYGHERKENTVGTISAAEAREALRQHNGNVWAAITECVEQRQKKYGELLSRGNFTREDIVTSLTANHGSLEAAYVELSKSQLKPFLMRIWGPPQGADNDSAPPPPPANNRPDEWEGVVVAAVMGGVAAGRGSGGDKPDEVSLDNREISTNTNNSEASSSNNNEARVRSWLTTQGEESSPQPTRGGMTANKRRELRLKRDRRYSDVQRYLTDCYFANSGSLKITAGERYSSVQNLAEGRPDYEERYKSWNDLVGSEADQRIDDEESISPSVVKFTLRVPFKKMDRDNEESEDNQERRPPVLQSVVNSSKTSEADEEENEYPANEYTRNQIENEDYKIESIGEPQSNGGIENATRNATPEAEKPSESSSSSESCDTSSSESFESVASSEKNESSSEEEEDVTQTIVNRNEIQKFFSAVNIDENIPFADDAPETLIGPPSDFDDSDSESSTSESGSEKSADHKKGNQRSEEDFELVHGPELVKEYPQSFDFMEEDSSDRDISSIPLDPPLSDEERSSEPDQLNKSKLEILDLLKESLSKDSVIDRIVTTLFATMMSEPKSMVQSPSVVSTSSEQEPEFYEAKDLPENPTLPNESEFSKAAVTALSEKDASERYPEILGRPNKLESFEETNNTMIISTENCHPENYKTSQAPGNVAVPVVLEHVLEDIDNNSVITSSKSDNQDSNHSYSRPENLGQSKVLEFYNVPDCAVIVPSECDVTEMSMQEKKIDLHSDGEVPLLENDHGKNNEVNNECVLKQQSDLEFHQVFDNLPSKLMSSSSTDLSEPWINGLETQTENVDVEMYSSQDSVGADDSRESGSLVVNEISLDKTHAGTEDSAESTNPMNENKHGIYLDTRSEDQNVSIKSEKPAKTTYLSEENIATPKEATNAPIQQSVVEDHSIDIEAEFHDSQVFGHDTTTRPDSDFAITSDNAHDVCALEKEIRLNNFNTMSGDGGRLSDVDSSEIHGSPKIKNNVKIVEELYKDSKNAGQPKPYAENNWVSDTVQNARGVEIVGVSTDENQISPDKNSENKDTKTQGNVLNVMEPILENTKSSIDATLCEVLEGCEVDHEDIPAASAVMNGHQVNRINGITQDQGSRNEAESYQRIGTNENWGLNQDGCIPITNGSVEPESIKNAVGFEINKSVDSEGTTNVESMNSNIEAESTIQRYESKENISIPREDSGLIENLSQHDQIKESIEAPNIPGNDIKVNNTTTVSEKCSKEKTPHNVQVNGSKKVPLDVSEKESTKKTVGYPLSRKPALSKLPVLTKSKWNTGARELSRPKETSPVKAKKPETPLGRTANRFGGGFNKITHAIKSFENKLEKDNVPKQKIRGEKGPKSNVKKEAAVQVEENKSTNEKLPNKNTEDKEQKENEHNTGKTVVVIVDISNQRRKSAGEIDDVGESKVSGLHIESEPGPESFTEESSITEEESFNFEREVRRCLAEGLVNTYDQAEIAVQLMELKFERDLSLVAAKDCSTIEAAITYLQQDCHLCTGKYPMTQMVDMLECEHRCCEECAKAYFTLQVTERTIDDCVCPFCKKPNLSHAEEDAAINYFSNLDILLKGILSERIHELFQRKLRDRTLMQDPNFKWCVKCSSGFIANPRQKRFICPDCKTVTCANCRRPWDKEHEGVTCDEYGAWLREHNDHENLLAKHMAEHGVICPQCKNRYALAKGGCMHLTCPQCKYEFCCGCSKPFLMGDRCTVSEFCVKLGLHAHHPRNCLFYLRDKEPQLLQKLLDDNGVEYRRSGEENATTRCLVQLLKETNEGLVDGICGLPTENVGFCRTHLVEHLVKLIREQKVDPAAIMDQVDAVQELRRRGKEPPPRDANISDEQYLATCIKMVQEEIPLE